MKTLLVAINAKYIHSNPAIYSLKAYSKDITPDIVLCEYTINNLIDEIVDDIYSKKPDFIGFSTYIWNVTYVLKAARELKKLLPQCQIWLGGPEVSYDAYDRLKENTFIDGIMRGEGEEIFRNLMMYYCGITDKNEAYFNLSDINGITYRDGNDIKETSAAELMNMSDIPFIYEDIKDFENRIIYYESSRGCPFSCSYCLSSVDKSVRFRSLEKVICELKVFIENKVPQVKFVDRTFNCRKSHAMEILKFIGENDNGITNFHFEVAADLIDDEQIELIKTFRPGLIQFEIGVQSVNLRTIDEINRKMNLEAVKDVVRRINEGKNVLQHLDIIAGLPYETLEDFKRSFNEVYDMNPAELQLGFLKILSGSMMKEKSEGYGIVYRDYPPYEVLYTKWINHDEICELKAVEEMVEVYYNSMQYPNSIRYAKQFFDTAYDMYFELAKYYDSLEHIKGSKYSRADRYNIFYEFIKKYCEDEKQLEVFEEILVFDIYLRENVRKRPAFAKDLKQSKDELYSIYRCLEKDKKYKEQMLHVEKFCYDIYGFANDGKLTERDNYIVFNYGNRNPIDNSAYVEEVWHQKESLKYLED
ncbi:MAG: DUF4080 domain-containing protein [Lachnospiraceae bacterium]|nr:DUF4080 domain-containing protein [Lachnospiraceae bacterium]